MSVNVAATDIEYTFHTWTQFERMCGLARVYGGVHFRDSIEVVVNFAHIIAELNAIEVLKKFRSATADNNFVQ